MEMTPEQIARTYSAALDSANLINAGKPAHMDAPDWADCVKRNKEHLQLTLEKDYWTTEDLAPLHAAIAA